MREYGLHGEKLLDANPHNVYLLYYHLVIVTKYRNKLLTPDIHEHLKPIIRQIIATEGGEVKEYGGEEDHIHILLKAKPQMNMANTIRKLKGKSSFIIRQIHPELKEHKAFWSRSYCLLTTGGAPIDVIKKYIERQGKKRPARP